jgi:hypothetical protein
VLVAINMALNPLDYTFLESVTITNDPLMTIIEFMRMFYDTTDDTSFNKILYSELFDQISLLQDHKNNMKLDDRLYLILLGFIANSGKQRLIYHQMLIHYIYNKSTTRTDRKLIFKYRKMITEIMFSPDKFKQPVNFFVFNVLDYTKLGKFESVLPVERAIYHRLQQITKKSTNDNESNYTKLMVDFGLSSVKGLLQCKREFEFMFTFMACDNILDDNFDNGKRINECMNVATDWYPLYNIPKNYNNHTQIFRYLFIDKIMMITQKSRNNPSVAIDLIQEMITFIRPLINKSPILYNLISNANILRSLSNFNDNNTNNTNNGDDSSMINPSKISGQISNIGQKLSSWFDAPKDTDKSLDDSIYTTNPDNDDLLNDILS